MKAEEQINSRNIILIFAYLCCKILKINAKCGVSKSKNKNIQNELLLKNSDMSINFTSIKNLLINLL